MGVETERKFLVKSDAWRATAGAGTVMAQGYLADTERAVVRVRVAGNSGFLTVKGRNTGISRAEFEYDIPAGDALTILETLSCGGIVKKTRFRVPAGEGLTWEIDVFEGENAGLVTRRVTPYPHAQRAGNVSTPLSFSYEKESAVDGRKKE